MPELQVAEGATGTDRARVRPVQVQAGRVDHVGDLLAGRLVVLEPYEQGLAVEWEIVQVELRLDVAGDAPDAVVEIVLLTRLGRACRVEAAPLQAGEFDM